MRRSSIHVRQGHNVRKRRVTLTVPSHSGDSEVERQKRESIAAAARRIEEYVNERLDDQTAYFFYDDIAHDLNISVDTVIFIMKCHSGWAPYGITL